MKIIEQSHEVLEISGGLDLIEKAGRTCYQSQERITEDSNQKFVKMLKDRGHHAMLEFGDITVKFVTNRGVTHELVRHRLCSFAQESTRYVNYKGGMEVIKPIWLSDEILGYHTANSFDPILIPRDPEYIFIKACCDAEDSYQQLLLEAGWKAQQAREVLPNSLKTEIVMKGNFREWMHVFKLRTAKTAHPQMVALMKPLLKEVQSKVPILFDGI